MMRNSRILMAPRVRLGMLAIILASLPIGWYLGSPLFLNQTVNEAIPSAISGDPTADQASEVQVIDLRRGQFGAIDSFHKGEGVASVYRHPSGQQILRLDDFRVTNGPDLYVYLSANPAPTASGQLHNSDALEVARLKGNVGNQNYELPSNVDLSPFKSVVIYCKQFGVVFSTAELSTSTT